MVEKKKTKRKKPSSVTRGLQDVDPKIGESVIRLLLTLTLPSYQILFVRQTPDRPIAWQQCPELAMASCSGDGKKFPA